MTVLSGFSSGAHDDSAQAVAGTGVNSYRATRARSGMRMRTMRKLDKTAHNPKLSVKGKGKADYTLAIVAILLSLSGLVFIYSASCYSAKVQTGDAFRYVKTQAVALAIGALLSVLVSNVKSSTLKNFRRFVSCRTCAFGDGVFACHRR